MVSSHMRTQGGISVPEAPQTTSLGDIYSLDAYEENMFPEQSDCCEDNPNFGIEKLISQVE